MKNKERFKANLINLIDETPTAQEGDESKAETEELLRVSGAEKITYHADKKNAEKKGNFKVALNGLMEKILATENSDHPQEQPKQVAELQTKLQDKEKSVIAVGLQINGNVSSESDIDIHGEVVGDVSSGGRIICSGTILGNVSCTAISMTGCKIKGDLTVETEVCVDSASVVVGDVKTTNLIMNGHMQGNIKAAGSVELQNNAVLAGNICAASVAMSTGALVKGVMEIQSIVMAEQNMQISASSDN